MSYNLIDFIRLYQDAAHNLMFIYDDVHCTRETKYYDKHKIETFTIIADGVLKFLVIVETGLKALMQDKIKDYAFGVDLDLNDALYYDRQLKHTTSHIGMH